MTPRGPPPGTGGRFSRPCPMVPAAEVEALLLGWRGDGSWAALARRLGVSAQYLVTIRRKGCTSRVTTALRARLATAARPE